MSVSHSPGLLLLGFFREPQALAILNSLCVCPDTRRHALQAICLDARKSRGGAVSKAGVPEILEIPPELKAYAGQVAGLDRLRDGVAGMAFEPEMVEIRPLLAIQAGVFLDRVAEIEATLGTAPSPQTIAEVCLPLDAKLDLRDVTAIDVSKLPMQLLTRNPNVSVVGWDVANQDPTTGVLPMAFFVGQREPCMQVIELGGKYILRNGYHRAVAAMGRGITHMPALVMHGTSWANVHEDLGKGWFFDARVLGEQMPTISHFEAGYKLPLRMWEFALEFSLKSVPRPI
jgi:hypothetical protein